MLQDLLGEQYNIIEEGLKSRTTIFPDPEKQFKDGREYLIPCLESHAPLDLVILFLGTNDLKNRYSLSVAEVAANVSVLIDTVKQSKSGMNNSAPQILLLAPPPLGKLTEFEDVFRGGPAKSRKLPHEFQVTAEKLKCPFFNTAEIISSSNIDGVHFDVSEHRRLGERIALIVKQILDKQQ